MERVDGCAPIGGYAVLSDQRTAALVAQDGAIDWMCAPRFDSEPIFGRLLDPQRAGVCDLHPAEPFTSTREYVEDTNVLETTFTTASGTMRVTDALTVSGRVQRFSQLVRKVECIAGSVELAWSVRPRAGWSCEPPRRRRAPGDGQLLSLGDVELLVQAFDLGEPQERDGEAGGAATLASGDSGLLSIVFTHEFPLLMFERDQCEQRLAETHAFWHSWLEPLAYDGPWGAAVRRSALALGACVHDQTGAMVASPATSLPETVGGDRNFDYRYCWVRDTCFALDAALKLGLAQFAQATLGWLLRAERRTHPRVNVFFDLSTQPYLPEQPVPAAGYRGSTPVLDGNSAGSQLQLGCYGDLMETAYLFVNSGSALDVASATHLAEVADHVCEIWRNPDSGIWELGDLRDYTHSKLQCWVALDRACRMAGDGHLPDPHSARWGTVRGRIGKWLEQHCVDGDGVLRRDGDGSGELDCAVLLAPRTGWIDAGDPRFLATIDAIRDELGAGGPLLYRYSGMRDQENAFLPCSFWMVDALARAQRVDEAAAMLDELVGLTTDVGLLAEEMDPSDRTMRGNIPLCLSHLALLNAAVCVTRLAQRPDRAAATAAAPASAPAAVSAPNRARLSEAGADGRTS